MFSGSSFGVGVTVADLRPCPAEALPAGVSDPAELVPVGTVERPARLGELLPPARRSDAELAGELQRLARIEAQLAAYRVQLVMELAARRPFEEDPGPGEPGAPSPSWAWETVAAEVSDFFPDELAHIQNCSRAAATTLFEQSYTLQMRLPATWTALADGALDWPRARKMTTELGWAARETDAGIIAAVEAAVLPCAADLSVKALEAVIRRELLARDADSADRRASSGRRRPTSPSARPVTAWPCAARSCP